MELSTDENSISLLDFWILKINDNGDINYNFYKKVIPAKADLLPHFISAQPSSAKRNIRNEIKRREERCLSPQETGKHLQEFSETMKTNGYTADFLKNDARKKNRSKQTPANDFIYFEFPYSSDKIERQVQKVFIASISASR
jgi:hypothetical protein